METLKISKIFSSTPGPRSRKEGSFSGQQFREEILAPAIKKAIDNNEILIVNIDGTAGYGPSFIEESFGGLIREDHIPYQTLIAHLQIVSIEEPYLIDDANKDMKDAESYSEQLV